MEVCIRQAHSLTANVIQEGTVASDKICIIELDFLYGYCCKGLMSSVTLVTC